MNSKNKNKLMKRIIPLSAITFLAALALVGCNQNSPSNSTETPSPNSSMSHDNGMMNHDNGMMRNHQYDGNQQHAEHEYEYAGRHPSVVDGLCDLTDLIKSQSARWS